MGFADSLRQVLQAVVDHRVKFRNPPHIPTLDMRSYHPNVNDRYASIADSRATISMAAGSRWISRACMRVWLGLSGILGRDVL
jgi:hypothetical protein